MEILHPQSSTGVFPVHSVNVPVVESILDALDVMININNQSTGSISFYVPQAEIEEILRRVRQAHPDRVWQPMGGWVQASFVEYDSTPFVQHSSQHMLPRTFLTWTTDWDKWLSHLAEKPT